MWQRLRRVPLGDALLAVAVVGLLGMTAMILLSATEPPPDALPQPVPQGLEPETEWIGTLDCADGPVIVTLRLTAPEGRRTLAGTLVHHADDPHTLGEDDRPRQPVLLSQLDGRIVGDELHLALNRTPTAERPFTVTAMTAEVVTERPMVLEGPVDSEGCDRIRLAPAY